jgi:hypothetical protein
MRVLDAVRRHDGMIRDANRIRNLIRTVSAGRAEFGMRDVYGEQRECTFTPLGTSYKNDLIEALQHMEEEARAEAARVIEPYREGDEL